MIVINDSPRKGPTYEICGASLCSLAGDQFISLFILGWLSSWLAWIIKACLLLGSLTAAPGQEDNGAFFDR
jgi:hypothetical protein